MTVSTVLDADFIIKASSIFDVSNQNLFDRLLEVPNRKFYCHFQPPKTARQYMCIVILIYNST